MKDIFLLNVIYSLFPHEIIVGNSCDMGNHLETVMYAQKTIIGSALWSPDLVNDPINLVFFFP